MFYILPGGVTSSGGELWVGFEALHEACEVLEVLYLEATTTGFQFLGLLELFVVGAKDDGNTPYGGLHGVVDANAKATTNVSHCGVTVVAGEETEAINYQELRFEV